MLSSVALGVSVLSRQARTGAGITREFGQTLFVDDGVDALGLGWWFLHYRVLPSKLMTVTGSDTDTP
jgi:hypothetical protein